MMRRMPIEWVFLDVGGVLFSDDSYFSALYSAIADASPGVSRESYDAKLRTLRDAQAEPFSEALVSEFVPDTARHKAVRAAADERWEAHGYSADELYPEVPEAMRTLAARYKLACITNHFSWVRDRASEAGFADLVSAWTISAEVGVEKPDPALFAHALDQAGVPADRVVMVGDRLDRDIAPAKALGMRTVWVLRNEAPDNPTSEQLAVPDAAVHTLDEVPGAIAGW
jgi:putative hydrolase of the HAD superfamily